ncbi:MAG: nucleoside hydrolase [Oscillospiraceae bacterium]
MADKPGTGKIPVLLDCDPGTDDALAMLMVFAAPGVHVVGVTTVAGNGNLEQNTQNALAIMEYFGLAAPLAKGGYPLLKPFEPAEEWINGPGGLGKAVLPPAALRPTAQSAVQLLHQKIGEYAGEIQLLATAPLTNLALLLEYPEDATKIGRIVLMGGSWKYGNASACAEFNIYTDPAAAKIVFAAGVPITMVGLDVSYHTLVTAPELHAIAALGGRGAKFVCDLMSFSPELPGGGIPPEGLPIFDALAAAALLDPSLASGPQVSVDVETNGQYTLGKTVIDITDLSHRPKNVFMVLQANKQKFLQLIEQAVRFFA